MTPALKAGLIKGMAHITGGGITENLPRVLPEICTASVDRRSWTVPPLFRFLQTRGDVSDEEMYRSFNMGIGLVLVCAAGQAERVQHLLREAGQPATHMIGRIEPGERRVVYRDER